MAENLAFIPAAVMDHGWIWGEHGDSSVAVWSRIYVASISVLELSPEMGKNNNSENWKEECKVVREGNGTSLQYWFLCLFETQMYKLGFKEAEEPEVK